MSKRPAGVPVDHQLKGVSRVTKVVRGLGEAVALRLVPPGVFSRWLQGGLYSSPQIHMGSSEKMEPGPFLVVNGSRVKHN